MMTWTVTNVQSEEDRACAWCNKPFVPTQTRRQRTCVPCQTRACTQCGKQFRPKKKNQRLCSSPCASRWNALNSEAIRSAFEEGKRATVRSRAEHLSQLYKGKPNLALRGRRRVENPQSATQEIRRGHEYTTWRTAVYERDNYTCQECNRRGNVLLNAHHVKPWATYPELRFDVNNGMTLCVDCHKRVHYG